MFLILDNIQDFLQISSNDLELHEQIGNGAFGTVYRATWLTRHYIVAVKKIHFTHYNDKVKKEFFKELSFMDRLHSPHIVNFYGAYIETEKCALVMEYMSLGSLYKVLHEVKLILTWPEQLSIALQAAKGINYLHQLQEHVLHRDIKSSNFLIERAHEGYTIKVCDFGLARTRNETTRQTTTTKLTLICTLQWTAPEVLRLEQHTDKSDIYSLGVVLWELVTYEIPYDGHQNSVICESVLRGERLHMPSNIPSNFRVLIDKCCAQNPNDRPNSSDLIGMIGECINIQSKSLRTYPCVKKSDKTKGCPGQ
jgi:serine/threonine protein kinase